MPKRRLWQRLFSDPAPEQRFSSISLEQWLEMLQSPFSTWSSANPNHEEVMDQLGGITRNNGPVFSLIAARAMLFSEARFLWRRRDNGTPQELFHTAELELLDRPWPGGTTRSLLTRMEFDASRAGNAFVRRLRTERRLVLLEPDWMTLVLASTENADHPNEAADVEIFGYIYDPPNGEPVLMLPDDVAHYAPIPDPNFRFIGMSWITPVIRDVVGDQAAIEHKNSYFEHAATPNLILKFPEKMKADKVEEYGKLIDARHAGVNSAYRTMYLGGGADPVPVGNNFEQMDFARVQGRNESRLASAAGVPPSWVGFAEGLQGSALNQGNFTAARRRFADGTLRPLWGSAAAALETILMRPPGASVHLWYNERDIPFLREDKEVAAQVQASESSTIAKLVRDGFTPESVIEAVTNSDWTLLEHDERFISVQLQSLEATEPPNQVGDGDDDGDNEGTEEE